MKNLLKRFIIKVPNFIRVYFCKKTHILGIVSKPNCNILQLEIKIFFLQSNNLIFVTNKPLIKGLRIKKKKLKALQGTTTALINQFILEASLKSYKNLKLFGIGFKGGLISFNKLKLLYLNVGYTHPIYFKIPKDISMVDYKPTKFIIYGDSNGKVTQIAARIRKLKTPEPYKGKGILYENEIVRLKEGKKA